MGVAIVEVEEEEEAAEEETTTRTTSRGATEEPRLRDRVSET